MQMKKWLVGLLLLLGMSFAGMHLWAWYQFSRAESAMSSSDYETAEGAISQCLKIWPGSEAVQVLAVRVARYRKQFLEAEVLLKTFREPGKAFSGKLQLEWMLLRAQMGDLEDVTPFLVECVENKHPDSAAILETLTALNLRLDRFREAYGFVDAWLKIDPDNLVALEMRGFLRERSNAASAAEEDYERILALKPDRHDIRRKLASLLLTDRILPKAKVHVLFLTEQQPKQWENWLLRARDAFERNNITEANKYIEQAHQLSPDNLDVVLWQGVLAMREEQYSKARTCLDRVAKVSHLSSFALEYHYRCLHALRDPGAEEALKRFERVKYLEKQLGMLQKKEMTNAPLTLEEQLEAWEYFLGLARDREGLFRLSLVLRADPLNQKAHQLLRDYYLKEKQKDKADYHEAFLKTPPEKNPKGN
jgi:tetratricopeptide (TPR) repeat protein